MKITIDTKEDSHQEIQKVIKMLSSIVGKQEVMSNQGDLFSEGSESQNSDMFSDDGSKTESSKDSSNGIFNMFNAGSETKTETSDDNTKEKKEDDIGIDIPKVQEYE